MSEQNVKHPSWLEVLSVAPSTLLEVNKGDFKIHVLKRPKGHSRFVRVKSWGIALGAKGYATPEGHYIINSKVKYPDWMVPDSDWARNAGLVPGTIYKGGTDANPLKERWLGITDPSQGVGIHGTADKDSIGTLASHGCIRMKPKAIIQLYDLIPRGTVIHIS